MGISDPHKKRKNKQLTQRYLTAAGVICEQPLRKISSNSGREFASTKMHLSVRLWIPEMTKLTRGQRWITSQTATSVIWKQDKKQSVIFEDQLFTAGVNLSQICATKFLTQQHCRIVYSFFFYLCPKWKDYSISKLFIQISH